MRGLKRYLLAMLLPLGVLLFISFRPALVLLWGQEARLATEPIDPREIFRGDHVNLKFAIEQVPISSLSSDDAQQYGGTVYVSLHKNTAGIYEPSALSPTPPEEGLYIRGKRLYNSSGQVFLDYGPNLKRFYVKENTGLELERAARAGNLTATVKLWRGIPLLVSLEEAEAKRTEP